MEIVDHKGMGFGRAATMAFSDMKMIVGQVVMTMRHQIGIMRRPKKQ